MRKCVSFKVTSVIAAACLFILTAPSLTHAEGTILRINTQMPPKHYKMKTLEIFKQEVEAKCTGIAGSKSFA
jgi:hypothetical protein